MSRSPSSGFPPGNMNVVVPFFRTTSKRPSLTKANPTFSNFFVRIYTPIAWMTSLRLAQRGQQMPEVDNSPLRG